NVQSDQATQGGTSEQRVLWTFRSPIVLGNEWHHFLSKKCRISRALRAQHDRIQGAVGQVLFEALNTCVVDPNEDGGRNFTGANQAIRCLIHLPLDAGERSSRVEQVLSVVQIEDWIPLTGIVRQVVARRQPHAKIPPIAKNVAGELVESKVSDDIRIRGIDARFRGYWLR